MAYLPQTWDLWLDDWPCRDYISIPRPPMQSVASVKYYDTENVEHTMPATDYFVDVVSEPGRVSLGYSKLWPTETLRPANAVCVRFTAGFPSYTGVVSTNGTAVTRVSGSEFNVNWPAGRAIEINGVVYTIASVTNTGALVLTATAGTLTAKTYITNDVPQKIKQAILFLVSHWYDKREPVQNGTVSGEIPFTVSALLGQDKIILV